MRDPLATMRAQHVEITPRPSLSQQMQAILIHQLHMGRKPTKPESFSLPSQNSYTPRANLDPAPPIYHIWLVLCLGYGFYAAYVHIAPLTPPKDQTKIMQSAESREGGMARVEAARGGSGIQAT